MQDLSPTQSLRIHFCDFGDMQGIAQKICAILQEHFTIILDSKAPQYLFYSVFGSEHIKYDCVRIFYTGENITPNFNICDYAIGFDHLHFLDRYLRYPLYLFYEQDTQRASNKHKGVDETLLASKKRFCNFVVSNGNADPYREQVFYALNAYKKVDSGGRYLNNIGQRVQDKFAFQKQCRFSLCFENSSTPGYLTEKLIQAAAAQTIPIYWGDPLATKALSTGGGGKCKGVYQCP
ncbi:glycosyltransferase family 10 [Helicobacter sp. XJK30-2]|nr:glycosyltransferase family 10 [Helicobacter sp. XJK30-2]MDL0081494.1 glycosyltransferase family 10 [Helicobacter sp. XJK30-2]